MAFTAAGSQTIGEVGSLLNSPALHLEVDQAWLDEVDLLSVCEDKGPVNGSGALAAKVPIWSPAALEAAAVGEGVATTLADPADASVTITVAKQKAGVGMTDELMLVAPSGYGPDELAQALAARGAMQVTDLICATFPNFTAGPAAGSPMSVGLLLEAYFDFLGLRCPSGQGIAVLHLTQLEQLVQSYRAEGQGDILTKRDNNAHLLVNGMQGYKASPLAGLHIVETTRVTTASSNYEAGIVGIPMPMAGGRMRGGSIMYKWADQAPLERFATGYVGRTAFAQAYAQHWMRLQASGEIPMSMAPPPVLCMMTAGRIESTGETAIYNQFMIGVSAVADRGVRLRSSSS